MAATDVDVAASDGGSAGAVSSSLPAAPCDPRATNRHAFYAYYRIEPTWPDITKVRTLRDAINGKVYLFEGPEDQLLVVKKMPEANVVRRRQASPNELMYLMDIHRRAHASGEAVFTGRLAALEDPMNEIGVLGYLCRDGAARICQHVPRLHGVYSRENFIHLCTEWCAGGELFDRVPPQVGLTELEVRRLARSMLEALRELHSENVGHRDFSLENCVLFDPTGAREDVPLSEAELRVIDFGQAVLVRAPDGTTPLRYFLPAGKAMYRSPEMYIPFAGRPVVVPCPDSGPGLARVLVDDRDCVSQTDASGRTVEVMKDAKRFVDVVVPPGAVPGEPVQCQQLGYTVVPVDIFACGVSVFVLAFGTPPWRNAQSWDPYYKFVQAKANKVPPENGIEALVTYLQKKTASAGRTFPACLSNEGMRFLQRLLRENPAERPTADEALADAWFDLPEEALRER